MTSTGLLLALALLSGSPDVEGATARAGSGSDLAPDRRGLGDELRVVGTVAAASGGALMGAGASLLAYHGLVLHEEVRVGLTREQELQGATVRVVTDLEGYARRRDEASVVWSVGWYSLGAGLVVALLGAGLSLSSQLFVDAPQE